MMIKLKSFKELAAMSNDQRQAELAPLRAKTAQAKANLLVAEADEKISHLQQNIQEQTVSDNIDFNRIADMVDELELLELRKTRFTEIAAQLFPTEGA